MVRGTAKQVLLIMSTFVLLDVGFSLECSYTTDTIEWSLSAVCWDKSLKSHDTCQWYVFYDKKTDRVNPLLTSSSPGTTFNCFGKLPLPLSTEDYRYNVLFAGKKWDNAFNLRIEDPGELTIKNCQHEVSEGDNVTCVCSTQREGSPPPVISWAGHTTSSTLHLYEVRGEHNKMYTCEMIWGNQTKTVSYNLLVRGSKQQGNSSFTSIIFITVAAVLVIIIVTTVSLIVIIRRKRRRETQQSVKNKEQGILSQHPCSNVGHGEDELIQNSYYGGFHIVGGADFKNVGDDYAEVMEAKTTEPGIYAGIEENNERQTTEPVHYVDENKERPAEQVEVYACVEKNKEKKDFDNEGNVYAIVDKKAKSCYLYSC